MYKKIIFGFIVIVLLLIVILITAKPVHNKKCHKFIRFGSLFPHVSGLNIGYNDNATIFQARPYFGNTFISGISECLGLIKPNKKKSLCLKFKKNKDVNFEVSVIKYPTWEAIGDTKFNKNVIYIGYSKYNDIILDDDSDIIIIVTGICNNPLESKLITNNWLDSSRIISCKPPKKQTKTKDNPVLSDHEYSDIINAEYESYVNRNLIDYKPQFSIISQKCYDVFPRTNGIVSSINYTPTSLGEKLLLVVPNRNKTLGIPHSLYIEISGTKTHLFCNDDTVNFFILDITSLDTILVKEHIIYDNFGSISPFYLHTYKMV